MGGGIPTFEYPLEKFIWTFHVSLFFFLSGYVYKITQKWKSKGTRTRFIAYKFIKVAVPYFSISIFYILINSLTAKTNTSFSVTDIFSLWKTPVAQYWYIYALFMLLLLYAVLSKVCNDWIITVFLVLLAYIRTESMCHYLEYVWVMRLALELGCVCRIFNTLIEKNCSHY